MTFEELRTLLAEKMQPGHLHQPLLVKALIEAGGAATTRQLAVVFLSADARQIAYYEKWLKETPLRLLQERGLAAQEGDLIRLPCSKLSTRQKLELTHICEQQIKKKGVHADIAMRDNGLTRGPLVADDVRFRLLKQAKGRCALCGATREERPLDVALIKPRAKGGTTDEDNLQVLCSHCIRAGGDRDDTDLRALPGQARQAMCPFCRAAVSGRVIDQNDHAFCMLDKYPVTQGHTLVIPLRHFTDFFDMAKVEHDAIYDLVRMTKRRLESDDLRITGFNIGVNAGWVAGQTIPHCHIHLIPRRQGDISDPRGGVRGVIPEKRIY